MELSRLTKYKNVIIQTHNIPDADAVGSGFALQCYLRQAGANVKLVYGGPKGISKPSLLMMLDALDIDIEYAEELPQDIDLLITVDSQRGAGNIKEFIIPDKTTVVVIDHHRAEIPETENTIIRPALASCATLVWDLLNRTGYSPDSRVLNALYYGLYTDTNGLSELRHPLDRDLSEINCDTGLIRKLKNSAITEDELDIVGNTLGRKQLIGNVGLFKSDPCDPNLLGFASDIAQQVVQIECCVVYCKQSYGIKLSIRSATREIIADEIAKFLCKGAGDGGGTVEKAGGFLSYTGINEVSAGADPEDYLKKRIKEYTTYFDHIYAGENDIDFAAMKTYKKLPLSVGFVKSTDVFPSGTKITIRTLEGDVDTITDDEVYLMIGIMGEVYPIKKERFEASYNLLDLPYIWELEYVPAILQRITGERHELLPYAHSCVPNEEKLVRAQQLTRATKVFTQWDMEKYYVGEPGDWLVANEGNYDDCYIVRGDIFKKSYI